MGVILDGEGESGSAGVLPICDVTTSPQLPRADAAVIPAAKLRDYVLNRRIPQGGPKARVFATALGLTRADWRSLRDQLLAGVQTAPASLRGSTQLGELYEVAINIRGHHGALAGDMALHRLGEVGDVACDRLVAVA